MKKIWIKGGCILFFSMTANLQAQQENDLEHVVIEGKTLSLPFKQTSQNVQIITRKQIEKIPATSIAELLSYYSGIDIRRRGVNGTQADISIRGSSFEQVLIMVNGIRMNDSRTGHNALSIPFDLLAVERIEVIKGPAARRFGQNAYAGAVNIITRPSGKDEVKVSFSGGEHGTNALDAGLNLSGKKFSQFLQAGTSQSDGYRYNTDYLTKNVWYQNQYLLSDGDIHFQAGIIEKKFGANGFYSTPAAKEQYEKDQVSLISIGWNQKLNQFKINANSYWRRAQGEYLFIRNNPSAYRNLHIGNHIGVEAGISYTSKLGITGFGGDFRKEYMNSNNLGDRQREISFIYADQLFSIFNGKLDITPGVSFAHYSDMGSFWYPGIDIGYKLNAENKLFANIGKTYRIPSYTDLYYSDPSNNGNPDLKPENAWSYELGYRWSHKSLKATVSFFRRESTDLIDWFKETEQDKWTPVNIAKVNTNGAELSLSQHFPSSFIVSYHIGYTYLDNELKNTVKGFSKYSLDNLRHQLVARVEHQIVKNKLTHEISYRYNDRVALDDYHLLDDKISFQSKKIKAFLQVNNILNTRYTETNLVPMPGRWVQAGITFTNVFK
ncbi:TonB-dependent siderophore receptor [Apibacter sp. HY039]|uniref:TonB-dependent receptor plug domain-containing protein n=1 Tax=Apibacter sp. HY039 TaxID=2501476 RepID=UPI000FEBEC81|nr:TonB-dependent receptor [Apibacter sp. HY039]